MWIAKQVLLVHVIVITLIGLYTPIHIIPSVHNSSQRNILNGIKTTIPRNYIILHLAVYFHFHNTEKFIRI